MKNAIDILHFLFLLGLILRHGLEGIYKFSEKEEDTLLFWVIILGRATETLWAIVEIYKFLVPKIRTTNLPGFFY